jgi:uncharacterized membrane protein
LRLPVGKKKPLRVLACRDAWAQTVGGRMLVLRLRRYFITGLIVILPIVVTVYIIGIVFRIADALIGRYIKFFLHNMGIIKADFLVPVLGLVISILLILFVGFLAANAIGRKIVPALENWFSRIPIIKVIYHPSKQMVNFMFSRDTVAFKKVVLVQYPSRGLYSIGFLTNERHGSINAQLGKDLCSVLIPTTPSPLTGFTVLLPKNEVTFLNITVEEGIRLIVSGGVIGPDEPAEIGKA